MRHSAVTLYFLLSIANAGEATLSCTAPTTNVDGTELTDLAGFEFHYGCEQGGQYDKVVAANTCQVTITGLPDATTCYFAARAVNSSGIQSQFSNEALKTLPAVEPPSSETLNSVTLPTHEAIPIVCLDPSAQNIISCPRANWIQRAAPDPEDRVFWAVGFNGAYQPPGPTLNNSLSGPDIDPVYHGWTPWSGIPEGSWISACFDSMDGAMDCSEMGYIAK